VTAIFSDGVARWSRRHPVSVRPVHLARRSRSHPSDNGPEFGAEAVQAWITAVGAKTAYIERGSPWENGYVESFNARLRDELLNSSWQALTRASVNANSARAQVSSASTIFGKMPGCDSSRTPAFSDDRLARASIRCRRPRLQVKKSAHSIAVRADAPGPDRRQRSDSASTR
jgi:transposase InsO family protein